MSEHRERSWLMDRRDFLRLSGAAAAAAFIPGLAAARTGPGPKPNVVMIFADDLGYCDTELYGCDRIPTPNINAIAREGTLFSDGYVTAPICSPSRAGLLTGCYQQRFGHEFNTGPVKRDWDQQLGLPLSETTLADAMKQAGYVTGMVGKWHLGTRPQFLPTRRGFDEFFGFPFGGSTYINPRTPGVRSIIRARPAANEQAIKNWQGRGKLNPIMRGEQPVEETEYLTDAFTREALAFIDRHQHEPFFLYLPYNAPHTPLQALSLIHI